MYHVGYRMSSGMCMDMAMLMPMIYYARLRPAVSLQELFRKP